MGPCFHYHVGDPLDFCLPIQLFNVPTIKQAQLSAISQAGARGNVETPRKDTLNSAYNEVAFNEKSAITKENLCTKYNPFTYKYIALNEKLPITKQNLCIFFFHYRAELSVWPSS